MNTMIRNDRRGASALLLTVLLGAASACGDDAVTPPEDMTETAGSSTGTTTAPSTETTTSGVDSTDTAASASGSSSSGSGSSTGVDSTGSSTGESESTTGEPVISGRTVHQLVNAGTRTASRSYTLVHTLGQPSPLQSTHESTSYRLQGGLVGANGSPP